MNITLYRSNLCPRCMMARKWLKELTLQQPHIQITEIDVLSHPLQAWKDGVRLIPAIKSEHSTLSSIYLTRQNIANFLTTVKKD